MSSKSFTFYWNNGIKEVSQGKDVEEAFIKSNHSERDVADLFCYQEGETDNFIFTTKGWVSK